MILTPQQILPIAIAAGFPPTVAVTMTAIALRESAGDPAAHNGNEDTGDDSWGLWQINILDFGVKTLLLAHGITVGAQLQDPATCARAAFLLWDHKNSNLNIAWYINRPGIYQQRYEQHLPAAQAAALALGI